MIDRFVYTLFVVFIGDTVIASVKVLKFSHSIMVCETICTTVERNKVSSECGAVAEI